MEGTRIANGHGTRGAGRVASPAVVGLDPVLRSRLRALQEEGEEIWCQFDREVRLREWHPFVPADYEAVLEVLLRMRAPGLRFLEWGSATGVITIMADMLGFEAYGIEIDSELVTIARGLAHRFESRGRFANGSFLPTGYVFRPLDSDGRLGTIGEGTSGYLELGHPLEDFHVVFGYPWTGEDALMHDLMRAYGGRGARLLLPGAAGVHVYVDGRLQD